MTTPIDIAALAREAAEWRRDFHAHPEIRFDVHRTAGLVAQRLRAFGADEVVEGVGRTGVVGVIRGRRPGRVVGLRADMDALPIAEQTNLPHASRHEGRMHACGHDGHTAMLLGAAKALAADRDFAGTVALIFQPAEEGEGGARAMLADGLMERFGIEEVYGLHNMPGMPAGAFGTRSGAIMGAVDMFTIRIEGRGSHAALPHQGVDPVLVGAHVVTALQGVVSRAVDPLQPAVVSVTEFHAGDAFNVIPGACRLSGTVRALDPAAHERIVQRLHNIVRQTAQSFGATAEIDYEHLCPPTVNREDGARHALDAATAVAGEARVDADVPPVMPGEDFAFMLNARPGAFVFLGNGDSANLHHPAYDFNDAIIPDGIRYWVELVRRRCA